MLSPYQRGRICHSKATHRTQSPCLGPLLEPGPRPESLLLVLLLWVPFPSSALDTTSPPCFSEYKKVSMDAVPRTPRIMPTRRTTLFPVIAALLPTNTP